MDHQLFKKKAKEIRKKSNHNHNHSKQEEIMESITHRSVKVNGISMHVAEKGDGPVVLLLHGFPELWYSWRHQIVALAARGYRAVAPDLRGFGDTDVPADQSSYSILHIVGDIIALIGSLGQEQVFVVAHDWGAIAAWQLCMLRPDLVKALVSLSVAYMPRNPSVKLVDGFRAAYSDEFYLCRFQKPGVAEAEFSKIGTVTVLKRILAVTEPMTPTTHKERGIKAHSTGAEVTLPSWLSEEDVNYFASKFEKTGFTGGFNYYRAMDWNWELTAPWTGAQIKVPTKFIVGDKDLTYHFPGIQDYIHKGGFKRDVPLLEDVIIMEGLGHFINQQKPHEITEHILEFLQKF